MKTTWPNKSPEPTPVGACRSASRFAGANRRWRCLFRYRGSRRESAVAQLFSLGVIRALYFMNTITKEQIQQFTPEQQAAVATMALRRVQKRERLLKQARQSRRSIFATAAMLAIGYGAAAILRAPPLLQLG